MCKEKAGPEQKCTKFENTGSRRSDSVAPNLKNPKCGRSQSVGPSLKTRNGQSHVRWSIRVQWVPCHCGNAQGDELATAERQLPPSDEPLALEDVRAVIYDHLRQQHPRTAPLSRLRALIVAPPARDDHPSVRRLRVARGKTGAPRTFVERRVR